MAKKKASKQPTKAQRVAKVRRALKDFTPWPMNKVVKVTRVVTVGNFSDRHVVLLENGEWSIVRCLGIHGARSGYSIDALDGVDGLRWFGIITTADRTAFYDWWRGKEDERTREHDLRKAKELAAKHGYRVLKK